MSKLHDTLTGTLVGLARATFGNEDLVNETTKKLVVQGLVATDDESFDEKAIQTIIDGLEGERARLVPECYSCTASCGRNDNYDMKNMWTAHESIRSSKSRILSGIRELAKKISLADPIDTSNNAIYDLFFRALFTIGMDDWSAEEFLPIIEEINALVPVK